MSRNYIYKQRNDIRFLFNNIAYRYDMLNSIMTFGRDAIWRSKLIGRINLFDHIRILDIGTGTGAIPLELVLEQEPLMCVGLDFSKNMLNIARMYNHSDRVKWTSGDALYLPFSKFSFDVVISAFLVRNVADLKVSLEEQYRVLDEGGSIFCLETSPPSSGLLGLVLRFYLSVLIPLLGRLIASNGQAYRYLSDSTTQFLSAGEISELMTIVGFQQVSYCHMMFGLVSLHWGRK